MYVVGGKTLYDAVRAYTKVDIFDAYHDKVKSHNGSVLISGLATATSDQICTARLRLEAMTKTEYKKYYLITSTSSLTS